MAETGWLEGDDIRPCGLARNNRLIRNGLISVAGQCGLQGAMRYLVDHEADVQTCPAVVGLPINRELQPKIPVADVEPFANAAIGGAHERACKCHEVAVETILGTNLATAIKRRRAPEICPWVSHRRVALVLRIHVEPEAVRGLAVAMVFVQQNEIDHPVVVEVECKGTASENDVNGCVNNPSLGWL